jgi:PAS domain S-box-containing protein
MKKTIRSMSFRKKLFFQAFTTCLIAILLAYGVFILYDQYDARKEMINNLITQADIIAANCAFALSFSDREAGRTTIEKASINPHIQRAAIYQSSTNNILSVYLRPGQNADFPTIPSESQAFFADSRCIVIRPVNFDKQQIGWVYLERDTEDLASQAQRYALFAALMFPVPLLVALLIAHNLATRLSKPIVELVKTAKAVGKSQDFSLRARNLSNDELGILTDTFNEMLEQVEDGENALKRSEARYRSLVENAPEAVVVFDWERNCFTEVNGNAEKMFKLTREELLRIDPEKLSPPFQPDGQLSSEYGPELIRNLNEQKARVFEWVHRDALGNPFTCEVRMTLLPGTDGRLVRGSITDISERKQMERELRLHRESLETLVEERTEELHSANEEIRKFVYIVSHDLRAPLVNLRGFAGELNMGIQEITDTLGQLEGKIPSGQYEHLKMIMKEDVLESLEFINSASDKMERLINAILKLSRIGHRQLYFEELEMKSLVEEMLKPLSYQIAEKQVEVELGDIPKVVADPTSMEQIIGNILTNAVNYLVPGRPGRIEIWGEESDEYLTYHVKDNGRGIAQEDMDKVFAIFRRAGQQNVPGEGMGLSYVQTLVRRHGGHIWVESELGESTTFSFTISKKHVPGEVKSST